MIPCSKARLITVDRATPAAATDLPTPGSPYEAASRSLSCTVDGCWMSFRRYSEICACSRLLGTKLKGQFRHPQQRCYGRWGLTEKAD